MESYQRLIYVSLYWFIEGFKQCLLGAAQTLTMNPNNYQSKDGKRESGNRKNSSHTWMKLNPITSKILQCGLLNGGVFGLSILLFDHALIPFLKYVTYGVFGVFIPDSSYHTQLWYWMELLLSYTFKMLWVIPLFWLSKPLNSFWFQEIAIYSYQSNRGRPKPTLITKSSSLAEAGSKIIADFFFSLLVEFFFLLQGSILDFIPIIGRATCIIQTSILYSLYAFEYKWINMGFIVQERLYRIEHNLPFYCGFGLPLAILTYIPESFFISSCVFSVFFPLLICSAAATSPFNVEKFGVLTCRIFSPVVWLANRILTRSKAQEIHNAMTS